ncbi:kelch repeat protein [Ancylostoma ceylanicum]|uniref:Kelch repeat protein n=1 Tax=Ancylostoma ceylanicum TaxID=53326 RepID=A0A0D6MAI0_9BILA|nr:kelch repeat protein [Ancylostoma ceylanicum]
MEMEDKWTGDEQFGAGKKNMTSFDGKRHVASVCFVRWAYGHIGLKNQLELPACVQSFIMRSSSSNEQKRSWNPTIMAFSRLFIDTISYGGLSCYSRILTTFASAYEKLSYLYSPNKAIESDSKCEGAKDEMYVNSGELSTAGGISGLCSSASPSDDVIDFVSTISIPSLASLEGEGEPFCVNHEHFLYKEAFTSLDRLRSNGMLCDVELSVGDHRSIAAHKVVLAAVIPYFEAMFAMDMSELKNRNIIIHSTCLTSAMVLLEILCSESPVTYSLPAMEATERFIEKYFKLISRNEEFLQISVDDLVSVLSMDGLYVEGEEKVFEDAVAWIQHDPEERKAFASRILACIRLTNLSPSFLAATVARHPLIRDDPRCKELMAPMPTARSFVSAAFLHKELYVCEGRSENGVTNVVQVFNPEKNKWTSTAAMYKSRVGAAVAVLDGYLYIMGGSDGNSALSFVERFSPDKKQWEKVAAMRSERLHPAVAVLNGKIYVCGGLAASNSRSDLYFENAMKKCRYNNSSRLYLSTNAWEDLNSVECFDPAVNRWFSVAPMKVVRSGLSAVAYDNAIYAIAGYVKNL